MQVSLSEGSRAEGLWPVHLKPKEDELLSSWLTRLAIAHGLVPHDFCSLVLPSSHFFSRANLPKTLKKFFLSHLIHDVDLIENQEVLEVFARGTGIPIDRVAAATLSVYKYTFDGDFHDCHHSWIMPVGLTKKRKIFGLQFCPKCLLNDKEPYYRRRWRLAFVTLCEKHFTPLLDSCSHCGSCITFIARKITIRHLLPTRCPSCHASLEAISVDLASSRVIAEELKFQEHLIGVLHQGWADVRGNGYVHSHLYFKALHMLADLLSIDRTAFFRDVASKQFEVPKITISLPQTNKTFQNLRVCERRKVLYLVGLLLRDWPNTFIEFCVRLGLSLRRDPFTNTGKTNDIPFWFWSVVKDYLVKPEYCESYEEYAARSDYIFRTAVNDDDRARLYEMLTP